MSDIPEGQKRCPSCHSDKPVLEFGRNASRPDGLAVYCRPCFREKAAAAYRRKRAALGKAVRTRTTPPEGHKHCPGCEQTLPVSEFHKASKQPGGYAWRCKSCRSALQKEDHLRRTYGLTLDERAQMMARQGDMCALCRREPAIHTDHCHVSGEVRGLLCSRCNQGLGMFRDDERLLQAAATYLAYHRSLPA